MPITCNEIPLEKVKSLLSIDESSLTGLKWKVTVGRARKGSDAGSLDSYGYYIVKIQGIKYRNHRLVWAMVNGCIQEGMTIDHIDRDPSNNKISNLRLADQHLQLMNRKSYKRKGRLGKSKGSIFIRSSGRIDASVAVNNKTFYKSGRDEAELRAWIDSVRAREYASLGINV